MMRETSRKTWLLLFFAVVMAYGVVAIPVLLIMPFKAQTERALTISYYLERWSPAITTALALGVILLAIRLWSRSRRWWSKSLVLVAALPVLVPAWFARQNHFEWMFNPLANSSYAKTSTADFVAGSDMVLAVKINSEAVAYPVRQMAYHHVIQDTVGGVPICVTY